jgi:hypothetical protein
LRPPSNSDRKFCSAANDAMCRFCCKSPKLTDDNFLAIRRNKSRLLIDMASDSLPLISLVLLGLPIHNLLSSPL